MSEVAARRWRASYRACRTSSPRRPAFAKSRKKADLFRELVPQALQLILQRLAVTTDIDHLPQGCVTSSLRLKDGLLLLIASRRGLDQRRPNRSVRANPS